MSHSQKVVRVCLPIVLLLLLTTLGCAEEPPTTTAVRPSSTVPALTAAPTATLSPTPSLTPPLTLTPVQSATVADDLFSLATAAPPAAELPVLGFTTPIDGSWADGPFAVAVRLQPRFPALAILLTGNESDGSLVLEDINGEQLQIADLGGIGHSESVRLEVTSSQTYHLRIRERNRTSGTYQLLLINLSPASPTALTNEVRNVAGEGFAEYVLLAEPEEQFLIYVEPLGPETSLQDAVVSVMDPQGATLAKADQNYLSEPELLFFTMPGDVAEFVTVHIADFFGIGGSFQLHIHRLSS